MALSAVFHIDLCQLETLRDPLRPLEGFGGEQEREEDEEDNEMEEEASWGPVGASWAFGGLFVAS